MRSNLDSPGRSIIALRPVVTPYPRNRMAAPPSAELVPPAFPPGFVGAAVPDDALAAAVLRAKAGADPGTILWSTRRDRVECAVVLADGEPLAVTLRALLTGSLALHDALAAHSPPELPIALAWPDQVFVNDGLVGGVRLIWDESALRADDVPAWVVLAVQAAGIGPPGNLAPGRDKDRTNLAEEGFGDVPPAAIVDSFARFLLAWMNRWEEDGFAAVRKGWIAHARGMGKAATLALPGGTVQGLFMNVTAEGAGVLDAADGTRTVALVDIAPVLPTWRHPLLAPDT